MNAVSSGIGAFGVLLAGLLKDRFGLGMVFAGSASLFLVTRSLSLVLGAFFWMPRDMARAPSLYRLRRGSPLAFGRSRVSIPSRRPRGR